MYVPNITIAGNTEVKILVWRRRGGREGVREGVTRQRVRRAVGGVGRGRKESNNVYVCYNSRCTLYMSSTNSLPESAERLGVTYITLPAVVPCLHMHAAVVAGVHKAIAGLVVKLIQHGHGGELGPAE